MFEMAAGYELTQTQPLDADFQNVDESVKKVLKYIFEEGFPHDITEVRELYASARHRLCFTFFICMQIIIL